MMSVWWNGSLYYEYWRVCISDELDGSKNDLL